MLNLREIRENPEPIRKRLALRADGSEAGLDRVAELDEERRALIGEGDELKARRNTASREIGERKRRGEDAGALLAEMREVAERVRAIDHQLATVQTELHTVLLCIPNPPLPDVPAGGKENNRIVRYG